MLGAIGGLLKAAGGVAKPLAKTGWQASKSGYNKLDIWRTKRYTDAALANRPTAKTGASAISGITGKEWHALGGFVGIGGIMGGVMGAFNPHEGVVKGALKEAAMGALFYSFLPAVASLQMAGGFAQMALGLPSALEHNDHASNVNRLQKGYERSRPVNYDPTANASLRKRSLQYIMQSRSNTRSYIGAEAKESHQQESNY